MDPIEITSEHIKTGKQQIKELRKKAKALNQRANEIAKVIAPLVRLLKKHEALENTKNRRRFK